MHTSQNIASFGPGYGRIRYTFSKIHEVIEVPDLIDLQRESYGAFLQDHIAPEKREKKGLQAVLMDFFPISDFSDSSLLEFVGYDLEPPKYQDKEAKRKGVTYASVLRVRLRLTLFAGEKDQRKVEEVREQSVYFGEIPLMTQDGTFIINGVERVIVPQIHRSPGVFFDRDHSHRSSAKNSYVSKVTPSHGFWLDFEFDNKELLCFKIDRKRKVLASTLLTALLGSDDPQASFRSDILRSFYQVASCDFVQGAWMMDFTPVFLKNRIFDSDVVAQSGEVLFPKGEKITEGALRLAQKKVQKIETFRELFQGRYLADDIIDPNTGEVVAQSGSEVSFDFLEILSQKGIHKVAILVIDHLHVGASLRNTVVADKHSTFQEALSEIYRSIKPGENPTFSVALNFFQSIFFDPSRYSLSPVGRVKLNARLGLETPLDVLTLQKEDIFAIVKELLRLKDGFSSIDDVDSLSNRRVRSVGELLESRCQLGLSRMYRSIRERMSAVELGEAYPNNMLNSRPLTSIIREFFGTSQLSQFMDQTNPLSTVNHKRRLSALGPGGLTRDRAGFEVRDVHPSHYGRICPVGTPEGANVGLINSLSIYARINPYGFIETPYRKVVDGKATEEVVYISALEEKGSVIAQSLEALQTEGTKMVECRMDGKYLYMDPKEVDYVDVSPKQILSVSAALIPFIESDDANRALMGSNMQRQAVPLLKNEAPYIGTGVESVVARDSGVVVYAKRSGVVEQVQGSRIVVRSSEASEDGSVVDIYNLDKFVRSNAGSCINQKPLVSWGDYVQKGDVLADGPSTESGELAVGRNCLVAFMAWEGYNYEDAIIISERLANKEDGATSIHITELEISARDTKLGSEEFTRDIPGLGQDFFANLDESGIIRVGTEVGPGDVLVGRVSPKAEGNLMPEERLLKAIFVEKATDVKDTSLRVPPGVSGVVVDVQIFSKRGVEKDERALLNERMELANVVKEGEVEKKIRDKGLDVACREWLQGAEIQKDGHGFQKGHVLQMEDLSKLSWQHCSHLSVRPELQEKIASAVRKHEKILKKIDKTVQENLEKVRYGDDLPAGVLKVAKVFIAVRRKIQPGDKMSARHGNKGVVSVVVPVEDMPYLEDGTPVDIILNPLGIPPRMNIGQVLETHLGMAARGISQKMTKLLEEAAWKDEMSAFEKVRSYLVDLYQGQESQKDIKAMEPKEIALLAHDIASKGFHFSCPAFEGASSEDIGAWLKKAGLPESGQMTVYDGRTGEPFHRKVTVGVMYMLKLHHLVDEKIHARSVGPYGLVTQQPLGGKALFGGQRFGEMEVWALEAYGAANVLQEMSTIKSDDIEGRRKAYESIVRGDESFVTGVPESFYVLLNELRALGLNMEFLKDPSLSQDEEGLEGISDNHRSEEAKGEAYDAPQAGEEGEAAQALNEEHEEGEMPELHTYNK